MDDITPTPRHDALRIARMVRTIDQAGRADEMVHALRRDLPAADWITLDHMQEARHLASLIPAKPA